MKSIVLLIPVAIALCSCHSSATRAEKKLQESQVIERLELDQTKYGYFKKYLSARKKLTNYLRLPSEATADDVRTKVALALKLPENASWKDLMEHKVIREFLTEERRKGFSLMFGLSADTGWIGLKDHLESLREKTK